MATPAVEEALQHLEEASIGTIHSFCAQILRERPVEAGVDPAFEELNEQESERLYQTRVSRVAGEAAEYRFAGFAARVRTIGVARFVGRLRRLSNNCSGPDASWWNGAIIRRHGGASLLPAKRRLRSIVTRGSRSWRRCRLVHGA